MISITAVRKIQAAKVQEARAWKELVDVFDWSPGEMPQFLQAMKKATDPVLAEELLKMEDNLPPTPVKQGKWPTRKWAHLVLGCGFPPPGSLRECDSHVREAHTKQAYHCSTFTGGEKLVAPGPSKQ